ncbi:MAG TPA: LLM class F420-dependent oxidoreductase [Actinomycetota bacterium]|nr:LLM class F420-dependent oxidoreductase [Actinomycetota bacterium]
MKVGVAFSNVLLFGTREGARALAQAAERHGVESLWTVEHVVVPKDYDSSYPYSPTGKMPGTEESPIPDPLIWLSYVAAHTDRIRLATGILILPQRSPVLVAKELATLDVLSGGRVTCGVGIGWLKEEFDAIGVPFAERASRTDESIGALRALWSDDETFSGRHHRFERARCYPKPVQTDGIPIVVGGHSEAAARRAGRLGNGFFPFGTDVGPLFEVCRRAAEEAGRDPASIELTVSAPPTLEGAERAAALGASRMIVMPPTFDPDDCDRAFAELNERLISKLQP